MATVVILNGPAGCGKDTLGNLLVAYLCKWYRSPVAKQFEMKDSMFKLALAASGLTEHEWAQVYKRSEKERPQDVLGGLSARQFMIRISEEWVKPTFGSAHFGNLANAAVINSGKQFAIFTDGGFIEEAAALAGHNVIVCRLHRDGFTFDGDSRDYLNSDILASMGIECRDYQMIDGKPEVTLGEIMQDISEDYSSRMNQVRHKVWGGLHE